MRPPRPQSRAPASPGPPAAPLPRPGRPHSFPGRRVSCGEAHVTAEVTRGRCDAGARRGDIKGRRRRPEASGAERRGGRGRAAGFGSAGRGEQRGGCLTAVPEPAMDFHNILMMASEQQGLNSVPVSSGVAGTGGGRGEREAGARWRLQPLARWRLQPLRRRPLPARTLGNRGARFLAARGRAGSCGDPAFLLWGIEGLVWASAPTREPARGRRFAGLAGTAGTGRTGAGPVASPAGGARVWGLEGRLCAVGPSGAAPVNRSRRGAGTGLVPSGRWKCRDPESKSGGAGEGSGCG